MAKPQRPHLRKRAHQLHDLLNKARSDQKFRDELIRSPKDTLDKEDFPQNEHWVDFFHSLTPNDFDKTMEAHRKLVDGEAEAEAEATD
jgi:hypothetical protein